jgi:hypothetical protein
MALLLLNRMASMMLETAAAHGLDTPACPLLSGANQWLRLSAPKTARQVACLDHIMISKP